MREEYYSLEYMGDYYSAEDMQVFCNFYDKKVYDLSYKSVMTGGDSVDIGPELEEFNTRCQQDVRKFLEYLRVKVKDIPGKNVPDRQFYRALRVPFNQMPLKLNEDGIFKGILECRLRIGK